MKAPHELLLEAEKANPHLFRQMAAVARSLEGNQAWMRLKSYCDSLVDKKGLSFAAGVDGRIDPLLSALKEGAKIYPLILEALAESGSLEDDTSGNSGVEVDLED